MRIPTMRVPERLAAQLLEFGFVWKTRSTELTEHIERRHHG